MDASDHATSGMGRVKQAVCVLLGILGILVILALGGQLYNGLKGLSDDWASARKQFPVGYIGLSADMPESKPPECIREENGRLLLWAGLGVPGQHGWYDVTGTNLPLKQFRCAFGRDTVKAIDYPIIQTAAGEIASRIYPERFVYGLEIDGGARAYPLTVLQKVEVVNEIFNGRLLAVTYCPLLERAVVYERGLDGEIISFGVSGYVYEDAFVLYDRATDSLWRPTDRGLTAITGSFKGISLKVEYRLTRTSWEEWRRRHPDTEVVVGADRSKGIPFSPLADLRMSLRSALLNSSTLTSSYFFPAGNSR